MRRGGTGGRAGLGLGVSALCPAAEGASGGEISFDLRFGAGTGGGSEGDGSGGVCGGAAGFSETGVAGEGVVAGWLAVGRGSGLEAGLSFEGATRRSPLTGGGAGAADGGGGALAVVSCARRWRAPRWSGSICSARRAHSTCRSWPSMTWLRRNQPSAELGERWR
jgi:hypothetical protein